jgi:hypothetical protein
VTITQSPSIFRTTNIAPAGEAVRLCACGQEIPRPRRGTPSERCPACQYKHRLQAGIERGRKWRESHPEEYREHNRVNRHKRTAAEQGQPVNERGSLNRELDRLPVTVLYWPTDDIGRGAKFGTRDVLPYGKADGLYDGMITADWLDEGAVIAYHSRTGPHRYRITGGIFREVRPRPRWGRMGRGRRQTVTSDWLYWTLLGYVGRGGR